jgi:hypothetical protein
MAITATPYGKFLMGLAKGQFDFTADTFKVALVGSSYAPNVDADEFFTDLSAEVTGTGYTAGGIALTGVAWTYDSTNNYGLLTADAVVWTVATFTARRAVIYKSTGSDATSRLVGYIDYGVDQSPAGVDFAISFASGVLRIRPYTP